MNTLARNVITLCLLYLASASPAGAQGSQTPAVDEMPPSILTGKIRADLQEFMVRLTRDLDALAGSDGVLDATDIEHLEALSAAN